MYSSVVKLFYDDFQIDKRVVITLENVTEIIVMSDDVLKALESSMRESVMGVRDIV